MIIYCFADLFAGIFNSSDIAPILKLLSLGGIFTYLHQTTTGILQGLGKTHLPLVHSVIGGMIRIPLMIYLTAMPHLGLTGTAAAYLIGFFIVAVLNMIAVNHYIKLNLDFENIILKPLIAGAGMLLLVFLFLRFALQTVAGSLLISVAGLIVYFSILLFNGGMRKQDLNKIPILNNLFK